jgi:glycosyltransferase involved in cell wall biosynthesis
MRIAQISPLFEAVPPKLYGGTERVVYSLTEELVAMGHDVTLFASGDSITSARLAPMRAQALRLDPSVVDWIAIYMRMMELIYRRADEFDVLHFHTDYFPLSLFSRQRTPFLTTLHGRLDIPEFKDVYELFDAPMVSISDSQRRPIPRLNWIRTVHHGMPADLLTPQPAKQDYLAFLGRISPEKRPDHAIEIAKLTGLPLRIAAKVDPADQQYFQSEIEPLLDHPLIEFLGEISDAQKNEFVGNAMALVCPYDWPEPFGLVLIEALACGTPVLAYRRGSIPEIIDDGITGFVCETLDEMANAVRRLPLIDRARCRASFDVRFTADRMARDYVALYERIAEEGVVDHAPPIRLLGARLSNADTLGDGPYARTVRIAGRGRHG